MRGTMEKKYFPIFTDISKKKVVVVGGGVIATRRVKTLVEFCECITVVAPEITPALSELVAQGSVAWIREEYRKPLIWEADMIIAATNRPEINREIKKDCWFVEIETGRTILFNAIDEKELCNFYFPSIVQTEEIVVGINSSGRSPKHTKVVREQIEKLLDSDSIYES